MRSAPVFQPALNSSRSVPQARACDDGLTFVAHYPADKYAASLAQGAARLELWTDLPVFQSDAASTSKATSWKSVPLVYVKTTVGYQSGYSFVAKIKCNDEAADGVFGFTYRIFHPDGQIDWLGSPSNDGQIHVPSLQNSPLTIRQLVHAHKGTDLSVLDTSDSVHGQDGAITFATLSASLRDASGNLSFSIKLSDVQSGLVIERTKSTWCTSRRFLSLSDVSPDFGANLLALELAQSSRREMLVLMPVFEDANVTSRLMRGSCTGDRVDFHINGSDKPQAKVSFALGTTDKLEQAIAACRTHAAKSLRTCSHEPLGLSWSARKALDPELPQSPGVEDMIPSLACSYSEPDCVDISFYSDSTAVEDSYQGLSTASSMVPPTHEEEIVSRHAMQEEDDDKSTVYGDRTIQADTRVSPLQPKAGLGFCTWEAMQNENRRPLLSEVVAALEASEHRMGKGSITALLIDDGWQDVVHGEGHRGRLNSFDMDPSVFDLEAANDGDQQTSVLSRYVSHIRQRFPSIKSVGFWMALAGYWDGIHPDGPIAKELSAPLRQEDATSDRMMPRASKLGKAAFEAMEGAATRYFGAGGDVIHSMGFTSALTNTSRTLHSQGMAIRCTDDFFPQIPDAHRHHLAHNVYNSLLLPEHRCDADMFSHCLQKESEDSQQDHTGYHASFRSFTDARLWVSDKADAPQHASLRALVSPGQLSEQGAKIGVQARGHLLPDAAFDDLIGEGSGPALKIMAQHEKTGSATLGLWNLRGGQASSFDSLHVSQILPKPGHCVVISFRTGKLWLLANSTEHSMLSTVLETGSWEVLKFSPLLNTSVNGVHVAMLGSTEHFMTPEGIHSITISASNPAREVRRRLSARRPSHHRSRSSRSSTYSNSSVGDSTETALTTTTTAATKVDTLMQQANGSQAVLLFLALINGLFAALYGVIRSSQRTTVGKSKRLPRPDILDAVISMLDKIQTLIFFGLLIVASWTSIIPVSSGKEGGNTWLPAWGKKQISESDFDDQTLKRVRLRPADAVATLKRCLASRTITPLREFPISIEEPRSPITPSPSSTVQAKPRVITSEPMVIAKPDVIFISTIDMAAKIAFLVICPTQSCTKSCTIDRVQYDCSATPWITISAVEIEQGSAKSQRNEDGGAFKLEVDMNLWLESQDETFVQSLSAPVSVSVRVSGA
ncbi:hypothetical protein NDA18_002250 [Ustilago nuda]|nr:hypothetical protein NDA18_002250 [Ustilago nuda]